MNGSRLQAVGRRLQVGREAPPTSPAADSGLQPRTYSLEPSAMWYFTWILGLGFACAFAILNAMWLELLERESEDV